VSKIESGERRLDVLEFLELARALQVDLLEFLREFLAWMSHISLA